MYISYFIRIEHNLIIYFSHWKLYALLLESESAAQNVFGICGKLGPETDFTISHASRMRKSMNLKI